MARNKITGHINMKVTATPSALKLIEELKKNHGKELLFHQSGGCCGRKDDYSIEAQIDRGQDLAELMAGLHQRGVSIISMRNRENRLEQMFVSLLEQAS